MPVEEAMIRRQLGFYVDELIREAIKTEIQSLDFSVTVKKLVHDEVRKYLTKDHVCELLDPVGRK